VHRATVHSWRGPSRNGAMWILWEVGWARASNLGLYRGRGAPGLRGRVSSTTLFPAPCNCETTATSPVIRFAQVLTNHYTAPIPSESFLYYFSFSDVKWPTADTEKQRLQIELILQTETNR